jgi:hypothetical protein
MKAIITRQNNDGTYDEVGMNNITISGEYKTKLGLHVSAQKFSNGGKVRIEILDPINMYKDIKDTYYI